MKITVPMYFFSAYNLLKEEQLSALQEKYDHCAIFIVERAILAFACADRNNVVEIIEEIRKLNLYRDEDLDPRTIQLY